MTQECESTASEAAMPEAATCEAAGRETPVRENTARQNTAREVTVRKLRDRLAQLEAARRTGRAYLGAGLVEVGSAEAEGAEAGSARGGSASVESTSTGLTSTGFIGTGAVALDRLLPGGGVRPGTLVEWFSDGAGGGAGTLALATAREACRRGGLLVVLDRGRQFYPPALVAWGLELPRVVVVRAATVADELWAADQALRCPSVAAAWLVRAKLEEHDFRRLQLAAETGGGLGLLQRDAREIGRPTWAEVQWRVAPLAQGVTASRAERTSGPGGEVSAYFAVRPPPNAAVTSAAYSAAASAGTASGGGPAADRLAASRRAGAGRGLQVELLRGRGGAAVGRCVWLEVDDVAATVREWAPVSASPTTTQAQAGGAGAGGTGQVFSNSQAGAEWRDNQQRQETHEARVVPGITELARAASARRTTRTG